MAKVTIGDIWQMDCSESGKHHFLILSEWAKYETKMLYLENGETAEWRDFDNCSPCVKRWEDNMGRIVRWKKVA